MRCDQFRGLNGWASELLNQTVVVKESGTRTYLDGKVEQFNREQSVNLVKTDISGKCYSVMFGNEYPLNKYSS